jgi:hypothetical protein
MKASCTYVLLVGLGGLNILSAQSTVPQRMTQPAVSNSDAAAPPKAPATDHLAETALSNVSLLGGTIESVNQVTNEVLLNTFGGGHARVLFDERTSIYLDRKTRGQQRDLRKGQRIHLDTALEGNRVFAQNIYLLGQLPTVESRGQVESYQASAAELIMADSSLGTSVRVHILPNTVVNYHGRVIAPLDIKPGSLITVAFQPAGSGRVNASVISVVAQEGEMFTFAGRVAHLDMRSQLVVLETGADHRTYDIYFDSTRMTSTTLLREGREVTVTAMFDGARYVGKTLSVIQ